MMPLVSIIIPVYNQNIDFLKQCIDSALNQTYGNVEVIVSDNHSTNGATELIASYSNQRLRRVCPVNFLSMLDHFGFAGSCASSESKYLSFLSSDDILDANAIEKLIVIAEDNPSVTLVSGNIVQAIHPPLDFQTAKNKIRGGKFKPGMYSFAESMHLFCPWKYCSTWGIGHLIRRSDYLSIGGFGKCDYSMLGDIWFIKEILKRNHMRIALHADVTAFFRERREGQLPPDGDRGLSAILDMLRYCNEVLAIGFDRGVAFRSLLSIRLSIYKTQFKLLIFLLKIRRPQIQISDRDRNSLMIYCQSKRNWFDRFLINQVLTAHEIRQ